ncbi:uncharacterized protein BKA78DRAFT_324960 [Phyllosticta capitalensis]|uniref:uncharacterized protein n=1 Tax=Phyllosticta capitalensis TaxID=121624 RepID=UPI0031321C32
MLAARIFPLPPPNDDLTSSLCLFILPFRQPNPSLIVLTSAIDPALTDLACCFQLHLADINVRVQPVGSKQQHLTSRPPPSSAPSFLELCRANILAISLFFATAMHAFLIDCCPPGPSQSGHAMAAAAFLQAARGTHRPWPNMTTPTEKSNVRQTLTTSFLILKQPFCRDHGSASFLLAWQPLGVPAGG